MSALIDFDPTLSDARVRKGGNDLKRVHIKFRLFARQRLGLKPLKQGHI